MDSLNTFFFRLVTGSIKGVRCGEGEAEKNMAIPQRTDPALGVWLTFREPCSAANGGCKTPMPLPQNRFPALWVQISV